ncbi:hypothetical protein ACVPOS_03665 [Staphylococcus aureus]
MFNITSDMGGKAVDQPLLLVGLLQQLIGKMISLAFVFQNLTNEWL